MSARDIPAQREVCALCGGPIGAGEQAVYLAAFFVWWHLACRQTVIRELKERTDAG